MTKAEAIEVLRKMYAGEDVVLEDQQIAITMGQEALQQPQLERLDEENVKALLDKPFYQDKHTKMWVLARDRDLIAKVICKHFGTPKISEDLANSHHPCCNYSNRRVGDCNCIAVMKADKISEDKMFMMMPKKWGEVGYRAASEAILRKENLKHWRALAKAILKAIGGEK